MHGVEGSLHRRQSFGSLRGGMSALEALRRARERRSFVDLAMAGPQVRLVLVFGGGGGAGIGGVLHLRRLVARMQVLA
jgi:hypothetical protein